MVALPPEIWCYIAKYIPEDDIRHLYSVNRVFFDIAMAIRYREIVIMSLNGPAQGHEFSMERVISCDPSILVRYVQSIRICSSLKRYYHVPWKSKAYRPTAFLKPYPRVYWCLGDRKALPKGYLSNIFVWARARLQLMCDKITGSDTRTVEQAWEILSTKFHAVKRFTILSDNKSKPPWARFDLLASNLDIRKTILCPSNLHATTITTPGLWHNLSSLTIKGNVEEIAHLSQQCCEAPLSLPSLTDLSLDFEYKTYVRDMPKHITDEEVASVASFLDSLSHQLLRLKIRCMHFGDHRLSDLFTALEPSTHLQEFTLYAGLSSWTEVGPLLRFLEQHCHNLKSLSYHLIFHDMFGDDVHSCLRAISRLVYPDIENLEIRLPNIVHPLSSVVPALQKSKGELKALSLKTIPLLLEDMTYLLESLGEATSSRLRSLKFMFRCGTWVNLWQTFGILLESLRQSTPSLEYLLIYIPGMSAALSFPDIQEQLVELILQLRSKKDLFRSWNVQEIHISLGSISSNMHYCDDLADALRECIHNATVYSGSAKAIEWHLRGQDWSFSS